MNFRQWLEKNETRNAPGSKRSKHKRIKLASNTHTPPQGIRKSRVYT